MGLWNWDKIVGYLITHRHKHIERLFIAVSHGVQNNTRNRLGLRDLTAMIVSRPKHFYPMTREEIEQYKGLFQGIITSRSLRAITLEEMGV